MHHLRLHDSRDARRRLTIRREARVARGKNARASAADARVDLRGGRGDPRRTLDQRLHRRADGAALGMFIKRFCARERQTLLALQRFSRVPTFYPETVPTGIAMKRYDLDLFDAMDMGIVPTPLFARRPVRLPR